MSYTLTTDTDTNTVLEKQKMKLDKFIKELEVNMLIDHDPLDNLLSMDLNEVLKLVKQAYKYYLDEEKLRPEVAKIKAIEEYTLWYYGNREREAQLRKLVNDF